MKIFQLSLKMNPIQKKVFLKNCIFSVLCILFSHVSANARIALQKLNSSSQAKPLLQNPLSPSQQLIKTLTFRIRGEPETLDWNRAHTFVEGALLFNLMEGLVRIDSSLRVLPALAKSWSVSADQKRILFKLRPGVKWSDGVNLRAQDFVYSWKRLLSPLTGAAYAYFLFDIENAQAFNQGKITNFDQVGVKALDDLTLEVRLTKKIAYWISLTAFWVTFPLRQDLLETYGSSWELPGRMLTLGPFTLASRDLESKVVLKKNPYYQNPSLPSSNISEVVALIVKDDQVALNLYDQGKLDVLTDLTTLDMRPLMGRKDLKSFSHLKTSFIGFLSSQYPASQVRLRRAIAMALDKSKLITLLHSNQTAASSLIPPGLLGYSRSLGLAFQPDAAKAELRISGISPGDSLTLEYLLPDWDRSFIVGQWIQSELKKNLNLSVSLKALENKLYRTQLNLGNYPFFDFSWSADYPDADSFLSLFTSESGNSHTHWKNTEYDALIHQAESESSQTKRIKLYQDAQKILIEDEAVVIPLFYEPNWILLKPHIKNLEINALDFLYLNQVESQGLKFQSTR